MRRETDKLIQELNSVLDGQPWFGRPVYALLEEIHPAVVFKKPNEDAHSLIDLMYHMITWAEFCLHRLQGSEGYDKTWEEVNDWRMIDPLEHTWARALSEFRQLHEAIITELNKRDDAFLDTAVQGRDYTMGFMVNGLIQHTIYHLGQIAYVKKWLIPS